jgi:hypothetical protein
VLVIVPILQIASPARPLAKHHLPSFAQRSDTAASIRTLEFLGHEDVESDGRRHLLSWVVDLAVVFLLVRLGLKVNVVVNDIAGIAFLVAARKGMNCWPFSARSFLALARTRQHTRVSCEAACLAEVNLVPCTSKS